jgi:hypothetical protein
MPRIGNDDQFESEYMAKLHAMLTTRGVPLTYGKDRAGIDTGLHLFVEQGSALDASQVRVWFQVKGKRLKTLSLERFHRRARIDVSVQVDHLQFWYAAPEPVYLVVYVEAAGAFVAEDIRDIVERQWPAGSFYPAVAEMGSTVTVHVDRHRVLDGDRLDAMLAHRSMRIDGPAFRGRPLGHRFDPLRSQIDVCAPELFERLARRLLEAHGFRLTDDQRLTRELSTVQGRLYQTFEWQSPAFAEFGVGPDDDFRDEPPIESIHGQVLLVLDSQPDRDNLADVEREGLREAVDSAAADATILVMFNGRDLSRTGGLWRSTIRDLEVYQRFEGVHLVGLEAMTSLLLVATLVYLDLVPELAWRYVNFQD